jgi:cytochrome c oxidase assembly factor CtaG
MTHTSVGPVAHAPELTPLSWSQVFTAWRLDIPMLLVLAVLGGGYVLGLVRLRRSGQDWPVNRTVVYFTGLLFFVLVTMSFLGTYELTLFWVRAVQNVMLLMIVPLQLAWGAPVTLLVRTTERPGDLVLRIIHSRLAKLITFPAIVSLILLTTPYLLYFTSWYELTLRHAFYNESLHVELMAIGFLYFWSRLRVDPVPHEYPHLISVWITFVEAIADGGLGLLLWLGHDLVAGHYYAALNRSWGPDLRWDQSFGGGAIWFIGDLSGVPFLGALWARLMKEDRDEAELYEREFDLADAAQALDSATTDATTHHAAASDASIPGAAAPDSVARAGTAPDTAARSGAAPDSTIPATAGGTTAGSAPPGSTTPRPAAPGTADKPPRSGIEVAVAADDPSQRRYRPWWETDPVLGVRYGFREPE